MSVSWGTQYAKLKTNLKLAQVLIYEVKSQRRLENSQNRLQLLQKKKTEQAKKAQNEIADFLNGEKKLIIRIKFYNFIFS